MSIVTPPTASTVTPVQTSTKPKDLGKDDFLNLLVTQLKNQDPLKPMDSSAYVAELAQFSQLEQTSNQTALLKQVLDVQQSNAQYSLLPLVGREVQIQGAMIKLGDGTASLDYSLAADAASVKLSILNASNQVVRTFDLGKQSAGLQQVVWDGNDQNGVKMQPGTYTYAMGARDAQNQDVPVVAMSRVRITGVRMGEGQPQVVSGDQAIDPGAILEYF